MSDPRQFLAERVLSLIREKWTDDEFNLLITPQRSFQCANCHKPNQVRVFDHKAFQVVLTELWGKLPEPARRFEVDVRHGFSGLSDEQLAAIADGRADIDGEAWEDEPPELPPAA